MPQPLVPSPSRLASHTWESASGILIVPLGSTEQHGPHLPLAVDALIAEAVADDLADRWGSQGVAAVVAPVLSYGASGEHEDFAGTISIGTAAMRTVVVEIGRSAGRWAERIVFVNGHGGNVEALSEAVAMLRAEGRDVRSVGCGVPGSDAHAGRTETSILLHLSPQSVRVERQAPGETRPLDEIFPLLRERGVAAVSPNGVLGDPTGASAEEGAHLLEAMGDAAWEAVRR
ncbi:creatinine amidohydrolase [Microbacterium sp. SLBN-154]|uniref:mycofactocin biosynthesis peptidyl-dipeptidase MftE n=1 Tax=Microbacterium sp. SLBN-154 TaxID=2768458 RepID=UPI001150E4C7|nr:mycofactocin biosynthesis peptidyl-dipeptidase MftE [Microbacterium sp. SLBN-154]TQK18588.1 creatinine amidohydrolase [Microbacterium sp. SLBN-154]